MKRSFFQAAVVSILLYGCTTRTLTKRLEKKLGGNHTRMLRAILNNSWQQLYGHLPPITKTIQARLTRHAWHWWRSKNELVSDVLLWNPAYGQSKTGRTARTYIQQLCYDSGCKPEDLPEVMNNRETWRERVRDIRTSRTTWWWWWRYKWYENILYDQHHMQFSAIPRTLFCLFWHIWYEMVLKRKEDTSFRKWINILNIY